MSRVGLVTCRKVPELTPDDLLLAGELGRRGIDAVAVVWDDPAVAWEGFDALVLRSVWDYHHRSAEFGAWLDRLEASGVAVWNPVPVVRGNLHKSYLRGLAAAGIATVPTVWLDRGASADLAGVMAANGWPRAVVKPAVSASAFKTWLVEAGEAAAGQTRLEELLAAGDALVQRFEPAIRDAGEWSVLFFGGAYSHAVRKLPGPGDFRVQAELGGSSAAAQPAPAVLAACRRILETLAGPWLYARVDGIEQDGAFILMELELIEPFLFLGADPRAAARLAEALESRLENRSAS
jgi:glutathione synthase/RimK-type ligase-like ATP-grasp enzyme